MPPRKNSRYLVSIARRDGNGKLFLTEPTPFRWDSSLKGTRTYTVKEGDSLHTIAYQHFKPMENAEHLWWVIAGFQPNPIMDATLDLVVGRTLYIPSQRVVEERILGR